jgi:hypothetical protein
MSPFQEDTQQQFRHAWKLWDVRKCGASRPRGLTSFGMAS